MLPSIKIITQLTFLCLKPVSAKIGIWPDIGGISIGEICYNSSKDAWTCTEAHCNSPLSKYNGIYKQGRFHVQVEKHMFETQQCRHIPGLAVVLHELDNIAHEFRDAFFLSRIYLRYNVSSILGLELFSKKHKDRHKKTRLHYESVVRAISNYASIRGSPPLLALSGHEIEKVLLGSDCVCFQNAVQKFRAHSDTKENTFDSKRAAILYRDSVYKWCAIFPKPRYALIVARNYGHDARAWTPSALKHLQEMIIHELSLPVVIFSSNDNNNTFCHQVTMFANAVIIVAHHGAEVGGNGIYLSPNASFIEMNSIKRIRADNFDFFGNISSRLITCNAVYSTTEKDCRIDYFHNKACAIDFDISIFLSSLKEAAEIYFG